MFPKTCFVMCKLVSGKRQGRVKYSGQVKNLKGIICVI